MPKETSKVRKEKKSGGKKKDESRKSKRESKSKSKSDKTPEENVGKESSLPLVHPEAAQLLRRYDRDRVGQLTRQNFLCLLRDYAHPKWQEARYKTRQPLSLTDSNGVPLGYARADANSEFEAGQLFERYDVDRTGTLSLQEFQTFYNDFQPQLSAFMDYLNEAFVSARASDDEVGGKEEIDSTPPVTREMEVPEESLKSLKSKLQTELWQLRQLCRNELEPQRQKIEHALSSRRDSLLNDRALGNQRESGKSWSKSLREYESLESDMDEIDEIHQFLRSRLRHHLDDTAPAVAEVKQTLCEVENMQERGRAIALREYDFSTAKSGVIASPNVSSPVVEQASHPENNRTEELETVLKVKDQMIYQLLQERTKLRQEHASLEAYVNELSDVSTQEMEKWSQLTDAMQTEIETLRSKLYM